MFLGATFNNQLVKAKYDGGLYQQLLSDGAMWGCAVTTTSGSVNIAPGMMICAGRIIPNEGVHEIPVSGVQDGYIRVKLQIDLSAPSTKAQFSQITTPYEFSTTEQFPPLTQEDINNTGAIYEMELGIFRTASGQVTDIMRKFGKALPVDTYSPNAKAVVSGNTLSITSNHPQPGSTYGVLFDAPEDFNANRSISIDETHITLTDLNGELLDDAWKSGAPVQLARRGANAFFNQGGGGLALKVVAVPNIANLPTGKNGLIVVQYVGTLGKCYIQPNEPGDKSAGSVWIKTDTGSNRQINVSKKSKAILMVNPAAVMIANGTSFSIATARQYYNGAWLDFTFLLYDNGVQSVPWTNVKGWNFGIDAMSISLAANSYDNAICTTDKIDVTKYSQMLVTWESTTGSGAGHSFGLSAYKDVSHAPGDEKIAYINKTGIFARTTDTISLESVSGEYYVKSRFATGSAAGNEWIYKGWLIP